MYNVSGKLKGLTLKLRRGPSFISVQDRRRASLLVGTFPANLLIRNTRATHFNLQASKRLVWGDQTS